MPFIVAGFACVLGGAILIALSGKSGAAANSKTSEAAEKATNTADSVDLAGQKAAAVAAAGAVTVSQSEPQGVTAVAGLARMKTQEATLSASFDGTSVPTSLSQNTEIADRSVNDESAALSPSAIRVRSTAFVADDMYNPAIVDEAVAAADFVSNDSRDLMIDDGIEQGADQGQAFTQS
jgi:hypothetical protein